MLDKTLRLRVIRVHSLDGNLEVIDCIDLSRFRNIIELVRQMDPNEKLILSHTGIIHKEFFYSIKTGEKFAIHEDLQKNANW